VKHLLVCATLFACDASAADKVAAPAVLQVGSSDFAAHAELARDFTCEGANISPSLWWTGAPPETKSFAIIVDDPDSPDPAAPRRTWVHWVVTGIPATVTRLESRADRHLPAGASNGTNDDGDARWDGPCPPIGRHRYVFTVYALDAVVPGATKAELLAAMKGHVLAKGELIGMYQKQGHR